MNMSWVDNNPAAREIYELGVINPNTVRVLSERCRDGQVRVLEDASSGVIFLETAEQTTGDYYVDPPGTKERYGTSLLPPKTHDDPRRGELLGGLVTNRHWLDVGAGSGSLMDVVKDLSLASSISAVEPNLRYRTSISERGFQCFSSLEELKESGGHGFGVVSMFHVLEHLHRPKDVLLSIRYIMEDDGVLVVEVPHAKDALLSIFKCEPFQNFTLWSEHLVLHTYESLHTLISSSGFEVVKVEAVQRYPLSNHLYWLSEGRPGGHVKWEQLSSVDLDSAYSKILADQQATDSLIAYAQPKIPQ